MNSGAALTATIRVTAASCIAITAARTPRELTVWSLERPCGPSADTTASRPLTAPTSVPGRERVDDRDMQPPGPADRHPFPVPHRRRRCGRSPGSPR